MSNMAKSGGNVYDLEERRKKRLQMCMQEEAKNKETYTFQSGEYDLVVERWQLEAMASGKASLKGNAEIVARLIIGEWLEDK